MPKLLWIDLEMTGLDAKVDRILEVAAIVTDYGFNELAQYETVVFQPPEVLEHMGEWSKEHHAASGLTARVPYGETEGLAEQSLSKLITKHFDEPAVLAGNSIHKDREFIRAYWPGVEKKLHYRMLDVSAWKVVMQNKFEMEYRKAEAHRALDDIRESIGELKAYLDYFQTE